MIACRLRLPALAVILFAAAASQGAADTVTLVVADAAPPLERFAAQELAGQFERLFSVETTIAAQPPTAGPTVVIGSPETNAAIRQLSGFTWPEVSEQGIVLQSIDRDQQTALVVGGGSPVATLWAVYELGHRFGIRYLLREDIYPETQPLKLDGFGVVLEPQLRTRGWRTINDFAIGPESWGAADQERLLGQLAKLKFNHLMLSVYPWQPFVHYEYGGVEKQTAMLFYGERYSIQPDDPGRTAFGGADEFTNPDFRGKTGYEEMTRAGIQHVRRIVAAARQLGMTVGLSLSPLEFPREFIGALPGLEPAPGLHDLVAAPGAKLTSDDARLRQLVTTKIRAYLETYPDLDVLYLTLPEFPQWDQHAEPAWRELADRIGPSAPEFSQLVEQARSRSLVASGTRGERSLKGNLVALAFLRRLLDDSQVLTRPDGKQVDLVITAVDPALFPFLQHSLPADAAALNFVDYTARRVAAQRDLLARAPARKVRSRLILTLADDNVGVLSQSALQSVAALVGELRALGWDGFSTRYWMLTELDSAAHYLSRASWDASVTAGTAHDDLFVAITGKQAVADRLWLGFDHIEKATNLIDQHDLGFAFPVQGILLKHYRAEPAPAWWDQVNEHYTQAMIELYRSRDAADARSQPRLFYYAKRSEYVLQYWSAVKAVRAAALAKQEGDLEAAAEQLGIAVEAVYDAIDTLGDVAEDQSDRGLIAVLNAYAYRPLLAEYERLLEE